MAKSVDEIVQKNIKPYQNPALKQDERAPLRVTTEQPVCPICNGRGYLRRDLPVEHPDFGKAVPCDCRRTELSTRRLQSLRNVSNLDALERFTFETFTPSGFDENKSLEIAYRHAYDFAQNPQGWLLMTGGYGSGKTHLAVAIANHVVREGKPAFFVVVPDLLDYLRATYNPDSETAYDQRFDQIRQAPLLILDDLGAQSATSWAQEKLFQLFNTRYNALLPTVITTNLRLEEIDRRIRSRLSDSTLVQQVEIKAPDYRQFTVSYEHLDLSSLPLHADKTFDTFEASGRQLTQQNVENLQRAMQLADFYARNPHGWLVFSGDYGCGKTHLAASIANACNSFNMPVLFVTAPDLLDYLRAAFNPNSTVTYDKRFDEIKKSPLLVLDDLGTESATPWANEKLYQLFNYRYNAKLPTVITMATDATIHPRLKSMLFGRFSQVFEITAPPYYSQQAPTQSEKASPPKPKGRFYRETKRPSLGKYNNR